MIDDDAPDTEDIETEEDRTQAILKQAHADWRRADDAFKDNLLAYDEDVRFARLGEQWDSRLKEARARDRRPCLTINKLPPFIRQVVNDARQNKPSIKVLPQDSGADPETAEIYSGLIRNIESASDADVAYDTSLECSASGGFGFFRINLAYAHDESWEQDIVYERIANPCMVRPDPDSTAADSSDWNIGFVAEMVSKKEFKRRYPDADLVDFESVDWADCPNDWREGDKVMVAEYWTREQTRTPIVLLSNGEVINQKAYETGDFANQGVTIEGEPRDVLGYEVRQYILNGVEVLSETVWPGKYIPIVPVWGEEVNLDGQRIFRSLIRDAKDAQVLYNVSRTASAEYVAMSPKAPYLAEKGSLVEPEKWASANTENYAFLEYKEGKAAPQRVGFPTPATGPLQEALTSSDEMKSIIGIYDAGVGARSNETSGRAIMARQKESDTSTFHFIDNLSRAIRHAGRILIDLIPKVYTPGRIVRILGEDGTPETVAVGEEKQPDGVDAQGKAIQAIYALGAGRYDLTVSVGPAFNTRREEAATQMIELIRAYPEAAPIIGDLLVKNLDWPGADEIAERLKQAANARQAPQGPPAQAPDPVAMAKAQTDNFKAQTDAQQGEQKLRIDAYDAETQRMKAVHDIQQPTRLRTPAPGDFVEG